MGNDLMAVLLNLLISSVGGLICICRMTHMTGSQTKVTIRTQYMLWFSAFAASGWSWIYESPANFAQILVTTVIVLHLALGREAWRFGAPRYTMKERRDLAQ